MAQKTGKKPKKFLIMTIISIALALIGVVLAIVGIAKSMMIALIIVGIVLVIVAGIMMLAVRDEKQKVCSNCGEKLIDCEYGYQVISEKRKISHGVNDDINVNYEYKVGIYAICPNCGTRKEYTHTFITKPNENVEFKIEQFCRARYNH